MLGGMLSVYWKRLRVLSLRERADGLRAEYKTRWHSWYCRDLNLCPKACLRRLCGRARREPFFGVDCLSLYIAGSCVLRYFFPSPYWPFCWSKGSLCYLHTIEATQRYTTVSGEARVKALQPPSAAYRVQLERYAGWGLPNLGGFPAGSYSTYAQQAMTLTLRSSLVPTVARRVTPTVHETPTQCGISLFPSPCTI
jgi:hypothetical protein